LGRGELVLRVCSALVLAPFAVAAAYLGGWLFAAFWAAAAIGVFCEWLWLVTQSSARAVLVAGIATIALAAGLAAAGYIAAGIVVILAGSLGPAVLAPQDRRVWLSAGLLSAGSVALAPILLRSDPDTGFMTIILLFAIVWSTDIIAYFLGRAIGGPKLMPRVSPHKTWAGAVSGTAAAIVSALIVAGAGGLGGAFRLALLACVLSVAAQAGDLLESALKRKFGAKDTGKLIPGHGGLMDRLDGFAVASFLAALIGIARGGFEAPGRGLLAW
jgi:phosphatidate cytidylyltransferase